MSSQDRLENVLRDIHVMISKSETYDTDRIIVNKKDMFNLIDRLNVSIYEIMDEYELTQQSRDRALRENKKEGDKIIWDASRQAEDIYAASVMYTEEALNHLHKVVEEANGTIGDLYVEFQNSMKQQQETIRENQLELKSQLQVLADTEKYLKLIEERNKEIERERAEKEGKKVLEKTTSTHVKPEIKINEEYFRKAGIPIEDEEEQPEENVMDLLPEEGIIASTLKRVAMSVQQAEEDKENVTEDGTGQNTIEHNEKAKDEEETQKSAVNETITEGGNAEENVSADDIGDKHEGSPENEAEPKSAVEDGVKVNLDAEYFKWKGEENADEVEEQHHGKHSLLEKLMGKKKASD